MSKSKPIIDRSKLDHPEHFDDLIREYKSSKRYSPTPLEDLLLELAAFCCSICKAPWVEIHHIIPISNNGQTEYSNLIVLCPNCHTRVHVEGVPNNKQLKQCKVKQEVSLEMPAIGVFSAKDKLLLLKFLEFNGDNRMAYSEQLGFHIDSKTTKDEDFEARKQAGHLKLESEGIIKSDVTFKVLNSEAINVMTLTLRLTQKGFKWLNYLEKSNRVELFLGKKDDQ